MYTEEQKFDSKVVIIIFSLIAFFAVVGIGYSVVQSIESSDNESLNDLYPIAVFVFVSILLAYLAIFKTTLEIEINETAISYRYFPFVRKQTAINYDTISTWQLRKLKNIFDYGGYGYKKDVIQKKTGFIMSGNYIFEFKLFNGKTIAFTSANKELMYLELKKHLPKKEIV
jgi:hypothetical protein